MLKIQQKKSERGVVLLEAALITPLILFLTILTIDFSQLLTRYALLNRAVYEGVRYASGVPSLTPGSLNQAQVTVTTPPGHKDVIARVHQILGTDYLNMRTNTTHVSSQLCVRNNGFNNVSRVVSVRINYTFIPLAIGNFSTLFTNYQRAAAIPIVVQDYGPYLLTTTDDLPVCQ